MPNTGDEASPLTIGGVLRYYREKLVPALAAALAVDDKFPEEVLNELRAAMTHLAAADYNGRDKQKREYELKAALRHVRRACLDCLKVCVQVLSSKSEVAIESLTEDLQLPDDVYKKMSSLRQLRKQLSAKEGERSLEDVVEEYETLANKYDEFYASLDEQFSGKTASMRRCIRKKKKYKNMAISFVLGILSSIVSSYVFTLIFGN
jgi:vacuolar-type H+-ATPase subunit I/STV1